MLRALARADPAAVEVEDVAARREDRDDQTPGEMLVPGRLHEHPECLQALALRTTLEALGRELRAERPVGVAQTEALDRRLVAERE